MSVEDLVNGQEGALIVDLEKVGEVAIKIAQQISSKRREIKKIPTMDEFEEEIDKSEATQRYFPPNSAGFSTLQSTEYGRV